VVHVAITVTVTFPDHDCVAIPVVTLPDNVTITIPIGVTTTVSDGHADRTDTDSDFFRAGRHRDANSSHCDGYYCKTLDHRMLLRVCESSEEQFLLTGMVPVRRWSGDA
jgi:hypothetical protein